MAEQTTLTAYIRRKLIEYGWLPGESQPKEIIPSPWESETANRQSGFKRQFNQFFISFFHWVRSHGWGFWFAKDPGSLSANELLPGFMENAESTARLEFDPGRQAWIAHLDYTQKSLACHLEVVATSGLEWHQKPRCIQEEATPIMQQILSSRQFGASPPDQAPP
jgi:hypothetical protein